MSWRINFSVDSVKFMQQNNVEEGFIFDKISMVVRKFKGERVNIDVKKLSGEWEGFYRIRVGKMRIIIDLKFSNRFAYVERIDWRGNVYK